jgi:phosphohistidine swiveling domain-containing protein
MSHILTLRDILDKHREEVGGKGFALAQMAQKGMNAPEALCVSAKAYRLFVDVTGLREQILMELNRKPFEDIRWEEMWDISLRLRSMFLNTPMPIELYEALRGPLEFNFEGEAVVVRSSAPGEDSSKTSFAGLHESYVNIKGTNAILEHIKLVWASLWSDKALLYRQELGLDVEKTAMAVVIQEIVSGEVSGVIFGQHPNDGSLAVIEAVYGLNQGLVDGTVEPDRWVLDRKTGLVRSHDPAQRDKVVVAATDGVRLETLGMAEKSLPPLDQEKIAKVFDLCLKAEKLFGGPQDVEWTFKDNTLFVLQSRPITTASSAELDDKRPWYLSLHRSFENLKPLRKRIENQLLPEMVEEAQSLANINLGSFSDRELAEEIERRSTIYQRWVAVYWDEFIPMAHGIRLFGQVYNDAVRPTDPYEFMKLLGDSEMISVKRNRMLEDMASMIRSDDQLATALRAGKSPEQNQGFHKALGDFIDQFGDLTCGTDQCTQGRDAMINFLLEMASREPAEVTTRPQDIEALRDQFFSSFQGDRQAFGKELLDLGRASYRLRDDDNIYLGRVKAQMDRAVEEGKIRIQTQRKIDRYSLNAEDVIRVLKDVDFIPVETEPVKKEETDVEVRARQLVGQPAGPGIGKGKARVIVHSADLMSFRVGEVLVCDAVDPNMTFVVPLSAGIVERRGGMLIHGAIIAREYGLACVTGVPEATERIRTGDELTVDGYLGIVVIHASA